MIESLAAKNGKMVLRRDGRLLASLFDPEQEARVWTDRALAELLPGESVIIMGLGAGYHSAEMVRRSPGRMILTIENDQETVKAAREIQAGLGQILIEPDWMKLPDHPLFRDAVGGTYRVFQHGPSMQIDPAFFGAVEKLLRGRDKLTFLVLLKTRPELFSYLNPEAIAAIGDEPVSIKTVRSLFSQASLASRERRIWRVLEELIV